MICSAFGLLLQGVYHPEIGPSRFTHRRRLADARSTGSNFPVASTQFLQPSAFLQIYGFPFFQTAFFSGTFDRFTDFANPAKLVLCSYTASYKIWQTPVCQRIDATSSEPSSAHSGCKTDFYDTLGNQISSTDSTVVRRSRMSNWLGTIRGSGQKGHGRLMIKQRTWVIPYHPSESLTKRKTSTLSTKIQ